MRASHPRGVVDDVRPVATTELAVPEAHLRPEFAGEGVRVGDGDPVDVQFGGLFSEQVDPAAAGRQTHHPEAVGVALHDVDGLGPDRAGGAEDHYCSLLFFSHGLIVAQPVGGPCPGESHTSPLPRRRPSLLLGATVPPLRPSSGPREGLGEQSFPCVPRDGRDRREGRAERIGDRSSFDRHRVFTTRVRWLNLTGE